MATLVTTYSVVLAAASAGGVYLLARSGAALLLAAGLGLLLAVLGAGTAGPTVDAGVESGTGEGGGPVDAAGVGQTATRAPVQVVLLLYGTGLLV